MFDLRANGAQQNNVHVSSQPGNHSSRILRQSDESGINTYRDFVYSNASAVEDQSVNFNIADSEMTRSIGNINLHSGATMGEYQLQQQQQQSRLNGSSYMSHNASSPANSSQFQNALRSSQQMLEQAQLETREMAEELNRLDGTNTINDSLVVSDYATEGQKQVMIGLQHQKSPLKLPDLFETQKTGQQIGGSKTLMMMSSVDPVEAERKRMATLNLDTISSEAESHMTSHQQHFIGDRGRHMQQINQQARKIDPDYMERIRQYNNQTAPQAQGLRSPGSQKLMATYDEQQNMIASSAGRAQLDEFKIGEIPSSSDRKQRNTTLETEMFSMGGGGKLDGAGMTTTTDKGGLLVLKSRPQNYESLSLASSTDFGQHSIGSSVEIKTFANNNNMNHRAGQLTTASVAMEYQKETQQPSLQQLYSGNNPSAIREEQYSNKDKNVPQSNNVAVLQRPFLPQHSTILEDLKEEDISFAMSSKASRPPTQGAQSSEALTPAYGSKQGSFVQMQQQNRPNSGSGSNSRSLATSKVQLTHMTETEESLAAVSQETGQEGNSKRTAAANNLSHQDDELIEELARTCFKTSGSGFYKPDKDSGLPTADEVLREEQRRFGSSTEEMQMQRKPVPCLALPMVTPPDVSDRRVNDLIKVDQNQFVTLSQVQDNRVQTSSGRSPYEDSSYLTENQNPPSTYGTTENQSASLTATQQQRVQQHQHQYNKPPSSAADIASSQGHSSEYNQERHYQSRDVDVSPTTRSAISTDINNQLFQTQVEHTQGRLAHFNNTHVGDITQGSNHPSQMILQRNESQKTVLQKRAQMLQELGQLGNVNVQNDNQTPDGASTAAQTQLETHMLQKNKINNIETAGQQFSTIQQATQRPICQGCNQAMVAVQQQASHRMMLNEMRQSNDSAASVGLFGVSHSERRGLNEQHQLLTSGHSGLGSYTSQQILCDDCMSRQLQSSDAGSLHSLRISQLLKEGALSKDGPKLNQYSSYHKFTNEANINAINSPSSNGGQSSINANTNNNDRNNPMRFQPIEQSRSAMGLEAGNSISDQKASSYLQQMSSLHQMSSMHQSHHSNSQPNFLQQSQQSNNDGNINTYNFKSDSKFGGQVDSNSIAASSIDSRLAPSHLVWSQHKKQQHLDTEHKNQYRHQQLIYTMAAEEEAKRNQKVFEYSNQMGSASQVFDKDNGKKTDITSNQQKAAADVEVEPNAPLTESKTASSLQFLSYLSSTANHVAREKQIETQFKYANVNNLLVSTGSGASATQTFNEKAVGVNSVSNEYLTTGYKTALRNFMDRQLERSTKQSSYTGSTSQGSSSVPMSRIFRERQSRRMFEDLQSIKGSCAKTYEELEAMHAEVLLGKSAASRGLK